jgi:hypothetical protein
MYLPGLFLPLHLSCRAGVVMYLKVMETPCDDPDKLWGMSGGGAAVLFLFLGILIGAGLGVGVMLLRQRRQRKQVSKRPEGELPFTQHSQRRHPSVHKVFARLPAQLFVFA